MSRCRRHAERGEVIHRKEILLFWIASLISFVRNDEENDFHSLAMTRKKDCPLRAVAEGMQGEAK